MNNLVRWFRYLRSLLNQVWRWLSGFRLYTGRQVSSAIALRTTILRRANEELENFQHIAAHELRGPLLAMRSMLDLAIREPGLPERTKEDIGVIHERLGRMATMLDDILKIARINPTDAPTSVDLAELCREVLADMTVPQNVTLELPKLAPVRTVLPAVRQVLRNLLQNALLHGVPSGGHISVLVREEFEGWYVTIEDDGPGIPDAVLDALDEPNYELQDGHGLGLRIVRRTVEKIGGAVWLGRVNSHGTRVTLLLPYVL